MSFHRTERRRVPYSPGHSHTATRQPSFCARMYSSRIGSHLGTVSNSSVRVVQRDVLDEVESTCEQVRVDFEKLGAVLRGQKLGWLISPGRRGDERNCWGKERFQAHLRRCGKQSVDPREHIRKITSAVSPLTRCPACRDLSRVKLVAQVTYAHFSTIRFNITQLCRVAHLIQRNG